MIGLLFVLSYRSCSTDFFTLVFSMCHSTTLLFKQASTSSLEISFMSFISSSASLAYTNPLVIISGPATILYVSQSIAMTIVTMPSLAKYLLSLRTIFPTSPTPIPST